MELYADQEGVEEPFVPRTLKSVVLDSPEPYCKQTVILVSARFLQEARVELACRNSSLNPDLRPSNGADTIRGYPVVAVPWLRDGEYEYWSNQANCVPA